MPRANRPGGDERVAENALLLAAARVAPAPPPPHSPRDWDYLRRAADRHGMAPLLHTYLAGAAPHLAPPPVAAALQSAYWSSHFRNAQRLDHLRHLLHAAAAARVPVMPLKGAILAPRYYPTPALRPMSDLDLLVPPEATAACAAVLGELGYREIAAPAGLLDPARRDPRHDERSFVLAQDGPPILVEVRNEPLDPMLWQLTEVDPALSARLQRHAAGMWRRGRADSLDGAPFVRIAPEDLLLHVTSHMLTRHADFRLLWLHDIGRIAREHRDELDWEQLAGAARALRLAAPVLAALRAADRWIGAPLPREALRRAFRPPAPRWGALDRAEYRLLIRLQRRLDRADLAAPAPADFARKLLSLLRLRGGPARLRSLRWALIPSRAYIGAWYGPEAARSRARYLTTVARRLLPPPLRGRGR